MPVTYSPFPQCCQFVNHGNSFLLNRIANARFSCALYKPAVQRPVSSGVILIKATSSPVPLCESRGGGHLRKSFPSWKILAVFFSPGNSQGPLHSSSVPSSTNGQPKLK